MKNPELSECNDVRERVAHAENRSRSKLDRNSTFVRPSRPIFNSIRVKIQTNPIGYPDCLKSNNYP
jgi:hypothetical protein